MAYVTKGDSFSSVLSVLLMVAGFAVIVIVFYTVMKYRRLKMIESNEFKSKFGTLTEGLNTSRAIGCYWNGLILTRWYITVLIMVTLRNYYQLQIMLNLVVSFIFQIMALGWRPMLERVDNNLSVFNESMVTLYLYLMICLTDFYGVNSFKILIGWALVATVLTSTTVNLFKFIITISLIIK